MLSPWVLFKFENGFSETVLTLKKQKSNKVFNEQYLQRADKFLKNVVAYREKQIAIEQGDKVVIDQYYNA